MEALGLKPWLVQLFEKNLFRLISKMEESLVWYLNSCCFKTVKGISVESFYILFRVLAASLSPGAKLIISPQKYKNISLSAQCWQTEKQHSAEKVFIEKCLGSSPYLTGLHVCGPWPCHYFLSNLILRNCCCEPPSSPPPPPSLLLPEL